VGGVGDPVGGDQQDMPDEHCDEDCVTVVPHVVVVGRPTAVMRQPMPSVPAFVAVCMRVGTSGTRHMPIAATSIRIAPITMRTAASQLSGAAWRH